MRVYLILFLVLFLSSCNLGLSDAPFTGEYLFSDIVVEPLETGAKAEILVARITAAGEGKHKYLGDVTLRLQQDINLEDFTLVHRITITDKEDQTLLFVGHGNLLPKDDRGNYIYSSMENLVEGDKEYESAHGKSTSQGEILLDARTVSCVQKGIWSYSPK